jgi:carbamoyl-phosphate synthase small subunit
MKSKKAMLVLADGVAFAGTAFGAEGETIGEVVFNTSMTGYQEILTDPSYKGQVVAMTYTQIGNYGTNEEDIEAPAPAVEGFIVKEGFSEPSNWRSTMGLGSYLAKHKIVGIQGIDTRMLTRHIRDHGAKQGIISTVELDRERLLKKVRRAPGLIGRDLVKEVTCAREHKWDTGAWELGSGYAGQHESNFRVVAYDFGIKQNILRMLVSAGCEVTVVPASTKAAKVLGMNPDGIFLSNGPGDPEGVPYAINEVRALLGKVPIFGICLGHQILGLAMDGKTYKLKFGHHGGNQPVKDLTTGKVEITAQNHGFAVDVKSLSKRGRPREVDLTHINLNDGTVEGMAHRKLPVFSVQYHPEASPGPHDSAHLFNRFIRMMKGYDFRTN